MGHEYVTAIVHLHVHEYLGICDVAAVTEAQSRGHQYKMGMGASAASQTAQMEFLHSCMMGLKSDLLKQPADPASVCAACQVDEWRCT